MAKITKMAFVKLTFGKFWAGWYIRFLLPLTHFEFLNVSIEYSGSWNNCFVQHCFIITLMRKKLILGGSLCLRGVDMFLPLCVWVCSRDFGFLTRPKVVHGRWTGVSRSSQAEWAWVCVSVSCGGRASCPGEVLPCSLSCGEKLRPPATLN